MVDSQTAALRPRRRPHAALHLLRARRGAPDRFPVGAARRAPLARHHRRNETVDALVVAGKCRRSRRPDPTARGACRGGHRRRRGHTDLRRPRHRGPLHSISRAAVDGDAGPRRARSDAVANGRGHGDRHRMAVRRTVGRRRHRAAVARPQDVDARRGRTAQRTCGTAPGAAHSRHRQPGARRQ